MCLTSLSEALEKLRLQNAHALSVIDLLHLVIHPDAKCLSLQLFECLLQHVLLLLLSHGNDALLGLCPWLLLLLFATVTEEVSVERGIVSAALVFLCFH